MHALVSDGWQSLVAGSNHSQLKYPDWWQVRAGSGPWARFFARLCLAGLPRGGGDGDAIRMGILHIMRENGIREGHRPVQSFLLGIAPAFYQKMQVALSMLHLTCTCTC